MSLGLSLLNLSFRLAYLLRRLVTGLLSVIG
jgi:hypothetical protein